MEEVPDDAERTTEVEALTRNLQRIFSRIIELVPHLPDELQIAVANMEDPTTLSYLIAASMRLSTEERQELLEESDLAARLRRLTVLATRELELLELGAKIQSDVRLDLDKGQREFFLRQQLKAIREELGEGDDEQAEIEELRAPARGGRSSRGGAHGRRARAVAPRAPAPASAEYGVVRTYLDWILALPWNTVTEDDLDLDARPGGARRGPLRHREGEGPDHRAPGGAQAEDATRAGPILCFVGPPGRRQDLARPVDRAGAGAALRRGSRWAACATRRRSAATGAPTWARCPARSSGPCATPAPMNPVFMVDEIDKMGADFRGDPASAMLEVLDPAQNTTFLDHYLDLPFDLSRVLFICTANVLDTIPPAAARPDGGDPSSPGYTEEEKLHIARRYLLPAPDRGSRAPRRELEVDRRRAPDRHRASTPGRPGVRQPRAAARGDRRGASRCEVAEGGARPTWSTPRWSREILGPQRVHNEVERRTSEPGVATGLAVTGAGRRDPLRRGARPCRATGA